MVDVLTRSLNKFDTEYVRMDNEYIIVHSIKVVYYTHYIYMYIYIYIYIYIQGVRFVRDEMKSDDRLGQTKKKSPLPFCKMA